MPLDKDSLMIRLENLADIHDLGESSSTQKVNLKLLLKSIFSSANNGHPPWFYKMNVKEKSLTGNMDLSEKINR